MWISSLWPHWPPHWPCHPVPTAKSPDFLRRERLHPSRLGQPGTGVDFPVGRNPLRLDSPCDLSVKPRLLAAWVGPHGYISGAALSPPALIHRQLRPKDLLLPDKGGRGTGSPRAVPSFLNHAYVTHRTRSRRRCPPSSR